MELITKDNEVTDRNMVQVKDANGEAITLAYVNTEIQVARTRVQAGDDKLGTWDKRLAEMIKMKTDIEKSVQNVVLKVVASKLL